MKLDELRFEIDQIDDQIMELFKKRMTVSYQIGKQKQIEGLPIFDQKREKTILEKRKILFDNEQLWPLYQRFLVHLFELSKDYQKHE